MELSEIMRCKNDEWGTPLDFFKSLDDIYNFTLDPCGTHERPLKPDIITIPKESNGLWYSWKNERVFCNPPYSKDNFKLWCNKIYSEKNNAQVIVLLSPLRRCSNAYFHDMVLKHSKLEIVRGRLDFYPLAGQNKATNPSGSALCIIDNRKKEVN